MHSVFALSRPQLMLLETQYELRCQFIVRFDLVAIYTQIALPWLAARACLFIATDLPIRPWRSDECGSRLFLLFIKSNTRVQPSQIWRAARFEICHLMLMERYQFVSVCHLLEVSTCVHHYPRSGWHRSHCLVIHRSSQAIRCHLLETPIQPSQSANPIMPIKAGTQGCWPRKNSSHGRLEQLFKAK